jgi:hypothetical protein
MAIIFSDDFEDGTHDAWEESGSSHTIVDAPPLGLNGSYALSFSGWGYVRKIISQASEIWVRFYARLEQYAFTEDIASFYDSEGTQILSIIRNGGANDTICFLTVIRGTPGGTPLATGTESLRIYANHVPYLIEIHFKPLNTGGVIQIRIDGSLVLDIDYSGDTTSGLENIAKVQLGGAYNYSHVVVDDAFFYDSDPFSPPPTIPDPPGNVQAVAGDEENTISWDASEGATSYNIYWDTETGVTKETGTKIEGVTSPYDHIGLENGIEIFYVVTAENEAGESDESNEVSAIPEGGGGGESISGSMFLVF